MERNMYLDKEKAVKAFMGTGEKNAAGEDLVIFLEKYDPHKYQNPCNTVDMAVFAYNESEKKVTKVLLIQRGNHPSIGWWALPGGFVEYRENLETAAARELQEETGIEHLNFEQLKTYGAYDRDPRTRIITTAYIALVPEGLLHEKAGDDAKNAGWFTIKDTEISRKNNADGTVCATHRLCLENKELAVRTESQVRVEWSPGAVLENKTYTMEHTTLLASDHSAVILEGYEYLVKRLADRP